MREGAKHELRKVHFIAPIQELFTWCTRILTKPDERLLESDVLDVQIMVPFIPYANK